jgi:hypothetical protein
VAQLIKRLSRIEIELGDDVSNFRVKAIDQSDESCESRPRLDPNTCCLCRSTAKQVKKGANGQQKVVISSGNWMVKPAIVKPKLIMNGGSCKLTDTRSRGRSVEI